MGRFFSELPSGDPEADGVKTKENPSKLGGATKPSSGATAGLSPVGIRSLQGLAFEDESENEVEDNDFSPSAETPIIQDVKQGTSPESPITS